MLLKNGTVLNKDFQFERSDISISGGKICNTCIDGEVLDCIGCYIIPGLVDIHTHGAMGYDNMDLSQEAMCAISSYMAENGVTTYLANVMTQSHSAMLAACENIAKTMKNGTPGAKIAGIYMEGPYFSHKYKGAQNPDFLRSAGLPDGEYDSGGQTVYVKDGQARLSDGTIAGSSAKLFSCVKKAISFGIPPEDAVKAATINPAKASGLDGQIGSIETGKYADLLILDKNFEIINVIINGKIYR